MKLSGEHGLKVLGIASEDDRVAGHGELVRVSGSPQQGGHHIVARRHPLGHLLCSRDGDIFANDRDADAQPTIPCWHGQIGGSLAAESAGSSGPCKRPGEGIEDCTSEQGQHAPIQNMVEGSVVHSAGSRKPEELVQGGQTECGRFHFGCIISREGVGISIIVLHQVQKRRGIYLCLGSQQAFRFQSRGPRRERNVLPDLGAVCDHQIPSTSPRSVRPVPPAS